MALASVVVAVEVVEVVVRPGMHGTVESPTATAQHPVQDWATVVTAVPLIVVVIVMATVAHALTALPSAATAVTEVVIAVVTVVEVVQEGSATVETVGIPVVEGKGTANVPAAAAETGMWVDVIII